MSEFHVCNSFDGIWNFQNMPDWWPEFKPKISHHYHKDVDKTINYKLKNRLKWTEYYFLFDVICPVTCLTESHISINTISC